MSCGRASTRTLSARSEPSNEQSHQVVLARRSSFHVSRWICSTTCPHNSLYPKFTTTSDSAAGLVESRASPRRSRCQRRLLSNGTFCALSMHLDVHRVLHDKLQVLVDKTGCRRSPLVQLFQVHWDPTTPADSKGKSQPHVRCKAPAAPSHFPQCCCKSIVFNDSTAASTCCPPPSGCARSSSCTAIVEDCHLVSTAPVSCRHIQQSDAHDPTVNVQRSVRCTSPCAASH